MTDNNKTNKFAPETLSFNFAIIGGGQACDSFLELIRNGPCDFLNIKIAGVCDVNPEAEGLRRAEEMGIYTTNSFQDIFEIKNLDGVIELTGNREVLLELIRLRPKGIGIFEQNIGRFLSYICHTNQRLRSADQEIALEKKASEFLIQQANERIVVLNPDFTIDEANEPYLRAVGKSREAVIGAHCYEVTHGLSVPCSSSQPELGCPLLETLRTGEAGHVIHEHPTPDEKATYCDMVTYPLKGQGGEIIQVIEVWRDITEELWSRLESRAKALKDDLRKLVQEDRMISLGKLVASSVHEINNPIQGLLTFSHLMKNILDAGRPGPEDLEKFKEYLSLMSDELERCGGIISGLLSFSRKPNMGYKDVDLNEILEDVITLTRHKMDLQNIQLSTELCPIPLIITGDVNQLQQCFLNLLFNAMEAMREGGQLDVTARLAGTRKHARIEIRDTGLGIPEEDLDHIFDPFFTTKEEGKGTGLGLSIVYGIVKNHGGNIKVNSRTGKGSSFVLHFPIS